MDMIKGGYALSTTDEQLLNQQRSITATINNNFIQVGATFLNMSAKSPLASDWHKRKFRDTNLQEWVDNPDFHALNVGFNLQFGWLDVDIDSGDTQYNQAIIAAMKFLQVDTRFAFGRLSKGAPSHLMVQLPDYEVNNYDALKAFEPKDFKIGGQRYKTELRSMEPSDQVKQAKQTVMPGSIYAHKTDPGKYDISVWYNGSNEIARIPDEVAATTPRKVQFSTLITGVAFGTFLYVIRSHWVEGTRQQVAIKVAGWLARVISESRGMNESETTTSVFCPCSTIETGESMLEFICAETGDTEMNMRKRALRDALTKLDNNPDAHIPGWPALESQIGTEAVMALRTVFMPGVDTSALTKMADQYLYDEGVDKYIDRDRFNRRTNYVFDNGQLEHRHEPDFMEIAGKNKPIWKIYKTSTLRRHVDDMAMHPDLFPGAIVRMTPVGEVIADDDTVSKAVCIFNTWSGWPIAPTEDPQPELIDKCNAMLDKLFGLLTQENKGQAGWLKSWIAWIIQHPGIKQQIAPVIVGGQGIGKSFFGNIFLERLFGNLWGAATPKSLENEFAVEPFIDKMIVFIDEAKFTGDSSIDEIKKIIRNDRIGGQEKYASSKTYNVYARAVFASNRFDINIGQQNIQDRALFYMKAYDNDYLKMNDKQFRQWAATLKPFFAEFEMFLRNLEVKQHYMYILQNMKLDQAAIESTALSSSNDEHIVESNMSFARRVAKRLVEDGRVYEDLDIAAPFVMSEFERRVQDLSIQMGLRNVRAISVLNEFKDNNLVEAIMHEGRGMYRFKYLIGTLTEKYGDAIGVKLEQTYEFSAEDFGDNTTDLRQAKQWRGRNVRFRNGI